MSDDDRRLESYFALVGQYPAMFENPEGAGFRIVLEPHRIREAERGMAERLAKRGLAEEWGHVGVVFQDAYMTILRDAVEFPNGTLGTYVRSCRPGGVPGVVVLAMRYDKVLLVRHFRHATRRWHIEVPRGFGEPGKTSDENARKELLEEIGSVPVELVALGPMFTDNGIGTGQAELFFAKVDSIGEIERDEGITSLIEASIAEVEALIASAEIDDSFTIAAFARARLRGLL